jgi:hypothetical protein
MLRIGRIERLNRAGKAAVLPDGLQGGQSVIWLAALSACQPYRLLSCWLARKLSCCHVNMMTCKLAGMFAVLRAQGERIWMKACHMDRLLV